MLTAIDSIFLVVIVTNATKTKVKVKETDPIWSQILFFPIAVLLCRQSHLFFLRKLLVFLEPH